MQIFERKTTTKKTENNCELPNILASLIEFLGRTIQIDRTEEQCIVSSMMNMNSIRPYSIYVIAFGQGHTYTN